MEAIVSKYRPRSLADFIGLEHPRAVVTTFAREPYSSAWLFVGPAGTGIIPTSRTRDDFAAFAQGKESSGPGPQGCCAQSMGDDAGEEN